MNAWPRIAEAGLAAVGLWFLLSGRGCAGPSPSLQAPRALPAKPLGRSAPAVAATTPGAFPAIVRLAAVEVALVKFGGLAVHDAVRLRELRDEVMARGEAFEAWKREWVSYELARVAEENERWRRFYWAQAAATPALVPPPEFAIGPGQQGLPAELVGPIDRPPREWTPSELNPAATRWSGSWVVRRYR